MNKTLTIAQGAVNARLVHDDDRVHAHAQQLLSYTEDGFAYMTNVGGWDGRNSFYDFGSKTFPAGFVVKVYKEFTRMGFRVNLVRRPLPTPLGPESPVVDSFGEDPRYDYQRKVVGLLERHGQIIAQVATGGGKSRIAKLAVMRLQRPTLFLTTRGILMYQMRDQFGRDLKLPVGVYGDGNDTGAPQMMNVGMVQTFAAWLADPDPSDPGKRFEQLARQRRATELLQTFEFVILEEAHEASSASYYDVLRRCRNAHYRLSLTGTPFMKDSEKDNLQLEASSGPVAIRVSEKMLIERGILARPSFKFIDSPDPYPLCVYETVDTKEEKTAKLFKSTGYERAYELGIVGNIARNQAIVSEVARAKQHGLTSMVLVQRKAHGRRLLKMLAEGSIRAVFIEGADDQSRRQAAIQALKLGKIDCLVGSTILDVGVDIPAVGLVVLAGGGKAEVAVRQRIGRGLREKHSGPNVAFIVDFVDRINNHLRGHAQERRRMIDTTPGFGEGVVADFDYSVFARGDVTTVA